MKKNYICEDCYENLDLVNGEREVGSSHIDKLYYSLFYNRFIREKIKEYKFNGKNYLSKAFSEIILDTIREKNLEDQIDIIFFIPSHRKKEALRGYNQVELLAKYIGKSLDIDLSRGNLVKTRQTKDQSSLNRLERASNLKDSFIIRDEKEIRDKKILLLDDIITTGATLEETSKLLSQAGARSIVGICLTSTKI